MNGKCFGAFTLKQNGKLKLSPDPTCDRYGGKRRQRRENEVFNVPGRKN